MPESSVPSAVHSYETAKRAILARIQRKGKLGESVQDTMFCPCCAKGVLSFGYDPTTSHTRAQCSTEGCVRWIE